MKIKNYRYGKLNCKGWLKPAGNGYEVCFNFGTKSVFVGNFIHATESTQWWNLMNREIRAFGAKHKANATFPRAKYSHFLSTHLYTCYYRFVDKVSAKHAKTYRTAVVRDLRSFKRLATRTPSSLRVKLLKAA